MVATTQPNFAYSFALASWMAEHHKTMRQYAREVGVHEITVYKWITGRIRRPQRLTWAVLARTHRVDFYRPQALGFAPFDQLADPGHSMGPGREDLDVTDLLRRNLTFAVAGVFLSTPVFPPLARLLDVDTRVRLNVGASDVARLAEQTRRIQAVGQISGGGAMEYPALIGESERVIRLLRGTFRSGEVRMNAHGAAALLTKYIGWNLYDKGFHDDARRLWVMALAMTREAAPHVRTLVQATIVQDMCHQAIALGQPQEALDLLGMLSGRERTLPPLQRANLSVVRAMATAQLGDVDETLRHIGWAEDHIRDAADERDADWWNINGWFNEADMSQEAGHAMSALAISHGHGRDDALKYATAALAGYPDSEARPRARAANLVVRLHAVNRDAAGTAKAGVVALDAARAVRSPRVVGELLAIRPYLEPMNRHPGIRELGRGIDDLTRRA